MSLTISPGTRCLVDTDVWSDALHLEHRDKGLHLTWWGYEWIGVSRKRQWLPKVPPESHERKRRDWLALPVLARLFASGALVPSISDLIEIELDTTPHSQTFDFFGFNFTATEKIDTGLQRRAWAECISNLRRPTKADIETILPMVQDERLAQLVSILKPAHLWDTLHIWSAEKAGITLFVSMERRFANQFENERKRHKSPVQIVSPANLVSGEGLSLSSSEEVLAIRDIFRQQQLRPMCQFRWPKRWTRRLWYIATKKIEFLPLHHRLEIPNPIELKAALLELELKELGLTANSRK